MIRTFLPGGMLLLLAGVSLADPPERKPTMAELPYGEHPHQRMDVYLPKGDGPYPVVLWYGGIWDASKQPANVERFLKDNVAVIAVETRTMKDAVEAKAEVPISWVLDDACRAVQFVRANAAKWVFDAPRLAVGGSSQGSLPALYVGCSPDHAEKNGKDSVDWRSTKVVCIAAHRSQPSIDPARMQKWVPGVKWGAPALGCSFEESLQRREALRTVIEKWSPDALVHSGEPPIYFEYNWGLTQPDGVSEDDYRVHSPAWGLGFQELARGAGAVCEVKYPGHPTEGYGDIWDFLEKQLGVRSR